MSVFVSINICRNGGDKMDVFLYLLLQIINGFDWKPEFGDSKNYKNWVARFENMSDMQNYARENLER